MNILLLCKRRYTNKDLIAEKFGRLYHFPANWAKQGHKVTVIALDYKTSSRKTFNIDGVIFHSVPFPSLFINTFITVHKLARASNPEVIIASGESYIGYWAKRLAEQLRISFVFDLYHDYRDFGSNRIPGMKYLFNAAARQADVIACDSSVLAAKMEALNRNTLVVPQGVDTHLFKPQEKNAAREKLNLQFQGVYIGYAGSFDSRFDYHCIMKAHEKLSEYCNVRFLFAGPNVGNYNFDKPFIDYLGVKHQEEIADVICCCDVMIIPYKDVKLSDTCNPCKLTEYIACRRPIVVADISDLFEYLSSPEASVYKPSDHEDLSEKLLQQIKAPTLQELADNMRWEVIAGKYLNYMQQINPPHQS